MAAKKKMPSALLAHWAAKKSHDVELEGAHLKPGKTRSRIVRKVAKVVRRVAPGTRHGMVRFNPAEAQPAALAQYWAKKRPKSRRVELDGKTLAPSKKRGKILRRSRRAVQKVVPGVKHGAVRFNPRKGYQTTVIARANPRDYIKGLHAKEQSERAEKAWPLLVAGKIDQDDFDSYVLKGKLPGGRRLPAASKARKNPAGRRVIRPVPAPRERPARGLKVLAATRYFGR